MKKLALISLLGILLVSFNIQPVCAGEVDILIKKLVEKGILTQSDAQELLKETQKETAKEKAETKEAAREVAKKEIESKTLALQKGLKGLGVGGTYFLEYFSQDYDDESMNADFNSFKVDRAYITIKKKFAPWFSSRVTADITYDSKRATAGASEVGWEFRLKYAYGKFDFNNLGGSPVRLESEIGLVHTFSDDYDTGLWPYRPQGKHFLDRHSIMSSADYGLNLGLSFGSMDKEFKKRISKKHAAKWGGIWLGVYNGSGYSKREENDEKVVETGGYVRPFNMIEPLKGLRFGFHVMRGSSNSLSAVGDYPDWEINQFMASYQHEYFTIMGQFYDGKGEDTSTDENDRDGYSIRAFVKMPFNKKLRIFGRYDVYDDDDNKADYDEKTTIGGLSYDLVKGVIVWAAIEDKDFESGLNKNDFKLTQIGVAIKF